VCACISLPWALRSFLVLFLSFFVNFYFFLSFWWGFKLQLRADILFRYSRAICGRTGLRIHLVEDEFSDIISGRRQETAECKSCSFQD